MADALSRTYLPDTEDTLLQDINYNVFACEVRVVNAFSEARHEELVKEARNDLELQNVIQVIRKGIAL